MLKQKGTIWFGERWRFLVFKLGWDWCQFEGWGLVTRALRNSLCGDSDSLWSFFMPTQPPHCLLSAHLTESSQMNLFKDQSQQQEFWYGHRLCFCLSLTLPLLCCITWLLVIRWQLVSQWDSVLVLGESYGPSSLLLRKVQGVTEGGGSN